MTRRRAPRPTALAQQETEAGFQSAVMELATLAGWLVWHDADSRKNAPGLPDLIMVKPPRAVFAELKTASGRLRADQRRWLDALGACPGVETYLWRPSDWPAIERTLLATEPLDLAG